MCVGGMGRVFVCVGVHVGVSGMGRVFVCVGVHLGVSGMGRLFVCVCRCSRRGRWNG